MKSIYATHDRSMTPYADQRLRRDKKKLQLRATKDKQSLSQEYHVLT